MNDNVQWGFVGTLVDNELTDNFQQPSLCELYDSVQDVTFQGQFDGKTSREFF